jgi:hypothetical protein
MYKYGTYILLEARIVDRLDEAELLELIIDSESEE